MKRVLAVTGLFALLGVGPTPLTFADAVQRVTTDGFDYRLAVTMAAAADASARSKAAPTRSSLAGAGTAVYEILPQVVMPFSRQVYVSATASVPILAPAAAAAAAGARIG